MPTFAELLRKERESKAPQKKSAFATALAEVKPAQPEIDKKLQGGQTLSRNDLHNLGVTERTSAQQRKTISDVMRRRNIFAVGGMGGFDPGITKAPDSADAIAGITEFPKALVAGTEQMIGTALGGGLEFAGRQAADVGIGGQVGQAFSIGLHPLVGRLIAPLVERFTPKSINKLYDKRNKVLTETGKKVKDFMDKQATTGWEAADPELMEQKWANPIQYASRVTGESAPTFLTALGVGFVTKNPELSLIIMGGMEKLNAFDAQVKAGASFKKADVISTMSGAWEAVTEKIPFDFILKGKAKNRLVKALIAGPLEGAQEVLAGMGQNFLEHLGYNTKDIKAGEVPAAVWDATQHMFDGWAEALVAGGILGGGAGAVIPGARAIPVAPDEAALDQIRKLEESLSKQAEEAVGKPVRIAERPAEPRKPAEPTRRPPEAEIKPPERVKPPLEVPVEKPEPEVVPEKPKVPTIGLTEKAAARKRAEAEKKAKERKPLKPSKIQIERGEQFGLTEQDVTKRLHKAQLRYEELRSKPVEDLTSNQKKELDFLKRKRTDIQALLGREIKPLSREAIEKRAKAHKVPFKGRTTKAILIDIRERAREQRERGKPAKAVEITPDKLLKISLTHEAKGARKGYTTGRLEVLAEVKPALREAKVGRREGFRVGQKELVEKHTELLEFAEANLPAGELALVRRAARRVVKARTPSEINKVIEAVNRMVENYDKRTAINEVKQTIKKVKKAKLRPEFQEAVEGITEEFSLSTSRESTLKTLESLLEAAERDEHQIGDIPQKLIDRAKEVLANTDKPTLKDFEVDELRAITDAISNLIHQDTLKKELLATRKHRDRKAAQAEATQAVEDRWGKKYETEVGKFDDKAEAKKLQKTWNAFKRWAHWDQWNLWTKARILGGRGGVAEEVLAKGLNQGDTVVDELGQDAAEFIQEKLDEADVSAEQQQEWSQVLGGKKVKPVTVNLPEARAEDGKRVKTLEMTVAERISFLRFITDPQNRAAMLADKNKGIVFARNELGQAIKITAEDMRAVIDSAPQVEKDIAQAMVDYINDNAPGRIPIGKRVQDVWLKLMGFPLRVHKNYVHRRRAREHQLYDPTHTTQNYVERLLERMGIFKPRAKSDAPFVIGDAFAEFHADVNRMASFAGKALPVHDAKQLLNDLAFRRAVKGAFKHGNALLTDIEKTIEFYQGLDQPFQGDIETVFKGILRRAHVGALGLKPHIVLYQTVSLLNANAAGMQAKYLYNPSHFSPTQMKRMRQILNEHSPTLKAREQGGSLRILTPAAAGQSLRAVYGLEKKKLKSIHRADSWVMDLIGLASEAEGKAKGITGAELNEYIARRTEEIVLESQPTWDATTLSTLAREGRSGAFKHMLVMFSSQRNKNFNMASNALLDYMFSEKTTADKVKLAHNLTIPTVANATLIYGISQAYWFGLTSIAALLGFAPKRREEDWKSHVVGIMERLLGNWVMVGDAVSEAIVSAIQGLGGMPPRFKRHRGTIMADAVAKTYETVVAIGKFAAETAKDEKYKTGAKKGKAKNIDTFWQGLETGAKVAGVLSGQPLQGIMQMASPFLPHRQETEASIKANIKARKAEVKEMNIDQSEKNKRFRELTAEQTKRIKALRGT